MTTDTLTAGTFSMLIEIPAIVHGVLPQPHGGLWALEFPASRQFNLVKFVLYQRERNGHRIMPFADLEDMREMWRSREVLARCDGKPPSYWLPWTTDAPDFVTGET